VRVSGTVLPRGLVGVVLLLARRMRDLGVRLGIKGVGIAISLSCDNTGVDAVVVRVRVVAPCDSCAAVVVTTGASGFGLFVNIGMGGSPVLTHGRMVYRCFEMPVRLNISNGRICDGQEEAIKKGLHHLPRPHPLLLLRALRSLVQLQPQAPPPPRQPFSPVSRPWRADE
jgi:hypothetical protein